MFPTVKLVNLPITNAVCIQTINSCNVTSIVGFLFSLLYSQLKQHWDKTLNLRKPPQNPTTNASTRMHYSVIPAVARYQRLKIFLKLSIWSDCKPDCRKSCASLWWRGMIEGFKLDSLFTSKVFHQFKHFVADEDEEEKFCISMHNVKWRNWKLDFSTKLRWTRAKVRMKIESKCEGRLSRW